MWKKGAGIKHERCGAAASSGDVREGGGSGGGAAAELRCLVCGKPAGCPACEFSDSCDTAAVSQLCMCRACLEDKDTYALYRAASSRRFPMLEPEGVAAGGVGWGGAQAPVHAPRPRPPAGSGDGGRTSAKRGSKGGGLRESEPGGAAGAGGEEGGGLRESEPGGAAGAGGEEGGGLRESEPGGGRKKKGGQSKLVPEQDAPDGQDKGDGPKGRRGKAAAKREQTKLLQQRL